MVRHLLPMAIGACLLATCAPILCKSPIIIELELTHLLIDPAQGETDELSASRKKKTENQPIPAGEEPAGLANAGSSYKNRLKDWIRFNHGHLAALSMLAFLWGVSRAWTRERQRLLFRASALTPEEMGLLNVIRLSVNRLWEIRKGKVVRLEEWRRGR